MNSLFPDDEVANAAQDRPWKKSETDKMLDWYFLGTPPDRIAIKLQRNPKAIRRRLEQFTYNENDRATHYEPRKRHSRIGLRRTENEAVLIAAHAKRNVPLAATAAILARTVKELSPDAPKKPSGVKQLARFIPEMDLIMALRYAYIAWADHKTRYLPPDKDYDDLVIEVCEYGGKSKEFAGIKKQDVEDYPFRIRGLANYLWEVQKEAASGTL